MGGNGNVYMGKITGMGTNVWLAWERNGIETNYGNGKAESHYYYYYYYVNRTQGTIFKHRYNQINQYK